MPSNSSTRPSRKILQRLASRPDIPNDVAASNIVTEQSEKAHLDKITQRTAQETLSQITVPRSTYHELESDRVDLNTRYDSSHILQNLKPGSTEAVEKGISPETCSNCEGIGTTTCENCNGDAHLPCPNDCGNGQVTCPKCRGHTRVECGTCRGDGQESCSNCGGDGKNSCRNCNYTGEQTCPECKRGFSSGKNKCSNCGGSGSVGSGSTETTCPSCNGDGKLICQGCGGDAKIPCGECGGSSTKPCGQCTGGTNPCTGCGGSGTLPCHKCANGKITCPGCDGESTVPCGCGDGRIDCETCDTEGEIVTAQSSHIEYKTQKSTSKTTRFSTISDMLDEGAVSRSESLHDVNAEEPSTNNKWIDGERINRHYIPVRKIKFDYGGDTHTVYSVNGELRALEPPESDRLKRLRNAVNDQREGLQHEHRERRSVVQNAIDNRRDMLKSYSHRRSRYMKIGKVVKTSLAIIALYGLYILI